MSADGEHKYFPALCPRGHRAFLAELPPGSGTARVSCPACGSRARLIPGAYYTTATRSRFERVAEAIDVGALRRERASTIASELALAARHDDAAFVVRALAEHPELAGLAPLLPEPAREMHAFIGLVIALLDAYAAPVVSEAAVE